MANKPATSPEGGHYQIRVSGHIDDAWRSAFEDMAFVAENDGGGPTTLMTGPIRDQAALHGVLERIRDLNLRLLMLKRMKPD